jgi:hypothetical protein
VSQAAQDRAIRQVLHLQLDENEINRERPVPRRFDETFT